MSEAQTEDVNPYLGMANDDLVMNHVDAKARIKVHNDALKAPKHELEQIERAILANLEAQHVDGFVAGGHSVSKTEATYPNVKDWEAVFKQVVEQDLWFLIRKQLNGGAFADLLEQGTTLEGVESFTKTTVNVRKKR